MGDGLDQTTYRLHDDGGWKEHRGREDYKKGACRKATRCFEENRLLRNLRTRL